MLFLRSFFAILSVIVIGGTITWHLDVPIPGSILGLVFFGTIFVWRGAPDPTMAKTFDHLIPHAPLLFVPAGAGVVAYLEVIASSFVAIAAVITVGTAAAMLVAGLTMQSLLRWHHRRQISAEPT